MSLSTGARPLIGEGNARSNRARVTISFRAYQTRRSEKPASERRLGERPPGLEYVRSTRAICPPRALRPHDFSNCLSVLTIYYKLS